MLFFLHALSFIIRPSPSKWVSKMGNGLVVNMVMVLIKMVKNNSISKRVEREINKNFPEIENFTGTLPKRYEREEKCLVSNNLSCASPFFFFLLHLSSFLVNLLSRYIFSLSLTR